MATLLLSGAGAALGGLLGGPIGLILGQVVGSTLGSLVDHAVLGAAGKHVSTPRLNSMPALTSTEGAAIPRLYGRARLGGQMIWATRFLETTSRTKAGGKGGGPKVTTYSYYANFAVALCEGQIASVRRIWADGKEIDLTTLTMRVYKGDEAQAADPLIVAKEGVDFAPAYRGTAYVVFEMMPLADFGNRIPQLSFEVVRPVQGLAQMIRAVNLIPGASEFVYSQASVHGVFDSGISSRQNRHQFAASSDWAASIDALQALCPNLKSVALVTSWFGDDLRAGSCTIAPRVESASTSFSGGVWSVAGLSRSTARVVSQINASPATGGTPSDDSIIAAINDLSARGLKVTLYPFILMDIAAGNSLPDPWNAATNQAAYPWRGRITCSPAPGQAGSPDGTAAAASQITAFFGSATPPASEWSFRRLILHYANLAAQTGKVEAIIIGSEMVALTRVRSSSGVYPAVAALKTLSQDVRGVVGASVKIGYAADWSEYGAHVLNGGSEIRFPLDPLWATPTIDFVGVDAYWPLTDWRDGTSHLDAALAPAIYDRDYLISRFAAGESYDFYYATAADRASQIRSPISDGAYNKPWIYRAKDITNWWQNPHFERVGGLELGTPTAWVPRSKPIWLTEFGCPAIDRGANQPNVFVDAKSSESAAPFFSRGTRDDLIQTRVLEAAISRFDPSQAGFQAEWNPVSPLYSAPMVDPNHLFIWAWDARPYPAFPAFADVWADAPNWQTGHWITGRLEAAPLDRLVAQIITETGCVKGAVLANTPPKLDGFVDGYVIDGPVSLRGAIQPLASLFGFDGRITSGKIDFSGRAIGAVSSITTADLVPNKDGSLLETTRAQETELPNEISISYADSQNEYRTGSVSSRRLEGTSRRVSRNETSVILPRAQVQNLADVLLQEVWAAREQVKFTLGPHRLDVEIGDTISLSIDGRSRVFRVQSILDGSDRAVTAKATQPGLYDRAVAATAPINVPKPKFPGPPRVHILDLAQTPQTPAVMQRIAVFADPWPGRMAVYQQIGDSSYALASYVDAPALVGNTLTAFAPGVVGRFDNATRLDVRIASGTLASVSDAELLAGQNLLAVQGSDGAWEIVQFARADLTAPMTYRLSRFLRGLGGEEVLASRSVAAGAPIVVLDQAVVSLAEGVNKLGQTASYRIGPAYLDYTESAFVSVSTTVTKKALQPYSPVRLQAKRSSNGVVISFLRRGRVNSDAWEPVEIALGEDSESYEIEIWAGVLKRKLVSAVPQALYAAADELADFGAAQPQLNLRIYQMSASVGRGFPALVTVAVTSL